MIFQEENREENKKVSFFSERNVGLFFTLIFHLIILLILIFYSIKTLRSGELSFIADSENKIAKDLEEERIRQEEEIKDQANSQLAEEFKSSSQYKSIAVNVSSTENFPPTSSPSKSENTSERENIPSNVSEGVEMIQYSKNSPETENKGEYRGPSVLSWTLDGRRALYLPIPAYKCQGEGIVYVQIVVGRNGYVKKAAVIAGQSSSDECLKSCALDAAKRSRFSSSETASDNQVGEIAYKFIAQ